MLKAKGSHARIPPHVEELIAGTPESGTVDAHGILPFYAGLVARAAAMDVRFAIEGDEVTIHGARRSDRSACGVRRMDEASGTALA